MGEARWSQDRIRYAVALAGALVLGGCGVGTGDPLASPGASAGTEASTVSAGPTVGADRGPVHPGEGERPPDVSVEAGGQEHVLVPWAWCWDHGCVDGGPVEPVPELDVVDGHVRAHLAEGFMVFPTWRATGQTCGPSLSTGWQTVGEEGWVDLPASGPAGTWDLEIFARAPHGGGDLVATVRVTTVTDFPVPAPELRLTSFFHHDREIVQYGPVELRAGNLAAGERELSAKLVVESADGVTTSIDLEQVSQLDCPVPGLVVLREPGRGSGPSEHLVGDVLGDPPYALTVEVTAAGEVHVAGATWPDDVDDEDSAILLDVVPALSQGDPADFAPADAGRR